MKTVYSENHALHNPKYELELGRFVPFKESPARVESILSSLRERNIGEIVAPKDFGLAPIAAVHSVEYISYLEEAHEKWVELGGNPEGVFPDVFAVREFANMRRWAKHSEEKESRSSYTADGGPLGRPGYYCFDMTGIIAEGTYKAAYDAAQVALTGAEILIEEKQEAVFALCRPPGHHAHRDLCGGYCFFNNAAIAVRHLKDKYSLKVAILDIDYHHGNGTQEIFYSVSNPLYVSLHGALDYPFLWGSEEEIGRGEGHGFNVNIPLKMGTQDEEYIEALTKVINTRVKDYYAADVLVVSLGVDTFVNDPIGGFFITTAGYTQIGKVLSSLSLPTLFVMEGGYDISEIGENVTNVLQGFKDGFVVAP